MTTKKLVKELMAFGISRKTARIIIRSAREEKLSNTEAYYTVCALLLEKYEKELKEMFGGEVQIGGEL